MSASHDTEVEPTDGFEDRMLVYLDVLGWKTACLKDPPDTRIFDALKQIHRHAEDHNEAVREKLKATPRHNPLFLQVQFGAFSDHFVWSEPADFGARVFACAQDVRELLKIGFLTRGAIVRGPLYHRDNVICGPALIQAVNLEEEEAFYPRVLITEGVAEACRAQGHLEPGNGIPNETIVDQTGRRVLNPFALGLDGPDDIVNAYITQVFDLPAIRQRIESELEQLRAARRHKEAEKWRYLRAFIEGPLLDSEPRLRPHWEGSALQGDP